MKLIIQIPCFNEADTIASVAADLPREIPGIDVIEYLVIDDGSSDNTIDAARESGIHHIVELGSNRGLAFAFTRGIERCLELGADIIVNTDGDNQYDGRDIPALVEPILAQRLDVVVGARPIDDIEHFSWLKKKLQRVGSGVVRRLSSTDVPDTTSGFRAYSAQAAMRLHVFNDYTYTLETIIQAGHMNMRVGHVTIRVNDKMRESRLIKSIPKYVLRSVKIMFRSYMIYKPLRTFFYMALGPLVVGIAICLHWLIVYRRGHTNILILAAILLFIGSHLLVLGVLADLISANRKLIQESLFYSRAHSYGRDRVEKENQ